MSARSHKLQNQFSTTCLRVASASVLFSHEQQVRTDVFLLHVTSSRRKKRHGEQDVLHSF
jgi:hypothetical protein